MPHHEHPRHPGFYAVRILLSEWLNPRPEHEGERVLWSDGTARNWIEAPGGEIKVLRRLACRSTDRRA